MCLYCFDNDFGDCGCVGLGIGIGVGVGLYS